MGNLYPNCELFLDVPLIDLVLIEDTGLGKSHIASAICYEAILQGYPTACITAFDLVSRIHKAYNPASMIGYYAKVRVLCFDELGYTIFSHCLYFHKLRACAHYKNNFQSSFLFKRCLEAEVSGTTIGADHDIVFTWFHWLYPDLLVS